MLSCWVLTDNISEQNRFKDKVLFDVFLHPLQDQLKGLRGNNFWDLLIFKG